MAAPTPPPRASAPPFEHDAGATAPSIHSTIFESRRKVLLAQNSAILVPLPANDLPPILPLAQDCGRRSRGLRARDRGSRRAGRERRQCRAQCPPRSVRGKLGDQRYAWIEHVAVHGRVKDAQAILAYLHASHDWNCDPGPIDGDAKKLAAAAAARFQASYNRAFGQSIYEDGVLGRQTWGAFFDVLQDEWLTTLELNELAMDSLRYVDVARRDNGCGES